MCGIVGIVCKELKRPCDITKLASMRDLQIHRGPDEEGLFVEAGVGLGHRRLSIIDLSSGRQPMTNEDGSLWIVYNGEIYNFKVLREELLGRGHVFNTHCDTEVILHLYEEKGSSCVDDLNGMFAFAIWNKRKRSLFLARDRMGVKPLYYASTPDVFLFSSEIKSLFASGHLDAACNEQAVFEYFMYRHVAGDRTLFKGVNSLLPGHTLTLENGTIRLSRYWAPFPRARQAGIGFDEASDNLSHLIQDAVKIRMVSDVPLGTFCSGGVDSSLVTAIAAQSVDHPINTFSVGFNEKEYDETAYAQIVSKRYGTDHHEIKLDNREFSELLPKMIWHNDEPLNFANSIHMFAISKLAKRYVTVVLTGEGSDELFAGYPRYLIPKIVASYQRFPVFIQKIFDVGSSLIKDHRMDKLRLYRHSSLQDMLLYNSSFLKREFVSAILSKQDSAVLEFRKRSISSGNALKLGLVTNLSILDQQNYLVSILMRQDKMSMAASVESRVPFLDYRIVEFANSLPDNYKIKLFSGKYILKKVAGKFLPDKVIYRKKAGFGVPLDRWLRKPEGMGALAETLLDDYGGGDTFNKKLLESVLSEHKAGRRDHSEMLWGAINLKLWRSIFKV